MPVHKMVDLDQVEIPLFLVEMVEEVAIQERMMLGGGGGGICVYI